MRYATGILLALTLVLGMATGCQPHTKSLPYNLQKKAGIVTMTVGDVTIVFEGLEDDSPGETQNGGTFFVAGPGSGTGKSRMLEYTEGDGVVDFIVAGNYSFKIIDEGTKLVYSDQTFALGEGPTKITIGKDGTVRADNSE